MSLDVLGDDGYGLLAFVIACEMIADEPNIKLIVVLIKNATHIQ